MGKRLRKTTGISKSRKNSILFGHYVYFKQLVDNIILFVGITHSEVVKIMDDIINTVALNNNINPKETDKKSYIVPRVYKGKREDIGAYEKNLKLSQKDEIAVNNFIDSSIPLDYEIENKKYKQYQREHKKK